MRGGKRGSHVEDLIPQSAHISLPYLLLLPQLLLSHSPLLWCSSILIKPAHHPPTLYPPPHLLLLLLLFLPLCLTFIHSSSFFSPSQSNPSFACSHLHPWLHASSSLTPRNGALPLSFSSTSPRHPPSVLVYDPCTTLADSLCCLPNPTFRLNDHFAAASLFRAKISFDVLLTDHWLPYWDVPEFITANLRDAIKN